MIPKTSKKLINNDISFLLCMGKENTQTIGYTIGLKTVKMSIMFSNVLTKMLSYLTNLSRFLQNFFFSLTSNSESEELKSSFSNWKSDSESLTSLASF